MKRTANAVALRETDERRNRGTNSKGFATLIALLTIVTIAMWRIGGTATVAAQEKTKVNPKDGLTYVWIAPGKFVFGCSPGDIDCIDDEQPAHMVTITKGFWIGQTPVTQLTYKKVAGANPSVFHGDQLPVENVSWGEAQAYCQAVEMRLPTEAEYEYAARGGTNTASYAPIKQIAWYNPGGDPTGGETHEVATKQPNAYGLYDMLGNVWEWVSDWYAPYDASPATDPKGPAAGQNHVVRGASWDEIANVVRVSFRNRVVTGISDDYNGFRCVSN